MKFSLGKLLKVLTQKETFPTLDISPVLQKSPNIWFDQEGKIEIKFKVSPKVIHYFKEVEFFPHQQIEKEPEGFIISCRTANYMQVLPQIKRWLPYIQVISPQELKEQLYTELKNYLQGNCL